MFLTFSVILILDLLLIYIILCSNESNDLKKNYIFLYTSIIIIINLIDFIYGYLTKDLYLINTIISANMLYMSYIIFIINMTILKKVKFDLHVILLFIFIVKVVMLILNYYTPIHYIFYCLSSQLITVFLLLYIIICIKEIRRVILIVYHYTSINAYYKLLFYLVNYILINLSYSLLIFLDYNSIQYMNTELFLITYLYSVFLGFFAGLHFEFCERNFKNKYYPNIQLELNSTLTLRQTPPYSNNILIAKGQEHRYNV